MKSYSLVLFQKEFYCTFFKNKYNKDEVKIMFRKWKKSSIFLSIMGVILLCSGIFIINRGDYEEYLKTATFPNCMAVDDYGIDGNEEGVIKKTRTKTEDYQQIYGLLFETYYMKDEKFAELKFRSLLQLEDISLADEVTTTKGKKIIKTFNEYDVIYFVLDNTTIHRAVGAHGNIKKNQRWFDVVGVDYIV